MRLLLSTFGSLGDLHPIIALALELKRRGHRPEIATVPGYREKIGALGLPFHALRPDISLSDEELVRKIVNSPRGPEFLLRDVLLRDLRATHADLLAAAAGVDLLITSELVYAAPIVSEQLRVPWISYALAPLSYFSAHDPSLLPATFSGPWLRALPPVALSGIYALGRAITHSWWRPIRDLRRELGLKPADNPIFSGKHSPRLDLALFSSVLQPPPPDWPRSTVQTGFCFFDEGAATSDHSALSPPVEQFLAAGEPPIVFTLGSSAVHAAGDFYAESARAAASLGRRALLLMGSNPFPPNLPSSIFAWDYLPYAKIFPRTAAIVHSGGVGTTAQALRAGRPMLIMPFAFDQFDNAARITRLGAGRTLPRKHYQADRAAHELRELLGHPRYAEAAARAGTQIRREHGIETACDAIERVSG
jgi:UDP:flavonoid glycosyltransferase YjiC (YdhE family)